MNKRNIMKCTVVTNMPEPWVPAVSILRRNIVLCHVRNRAASWRDQDRKKQQKSSLEIFKILPNYTKRFSSSCGNRAWFTEVLKVRQARSAVKRQWRTQYWQSDRRLIKDKCLNFLLRIVKKKLLERHEVKTTGPYFEGLERAPSSPAEWTVRYTGKAVRQSCKNFIRKVQLQRTEGADVIDLSRMLNI